MGAQGNYNAVFAERLRKLLENRGITITELAKHLQISRQAVSQYADGSAQPNIEKLSRIAVFFDVSSDYLIGLSEYERHETANYTAESMGIPEAAAQQLAQDKKRNNGYGISGATMSILVSSPFFGDFASALSEYLQAVSHANEWANTVPSIFEERKKVRVKQFLLNEALSDVLNNVAPLPDFSKREKIARIREEYTHAVDSQEDK